MGQTWCINSHRERSTPGPMDTRNSGQRDGSASTPRNSTAGQTNLKMSGQKIFGPANLGPINYQVVLLFPEPNPLGTSLSHQCQWSTLDHTLVTTAKEAWQRVSQSDRQTVLLVNISTNQKAVVKELVHLLNTHHLWFQATLIAVISDSNQLTPEVGAHLLEAGFSRVLTAAQCKGVGLRLHLQLLECSELRLKQQLMYSQALQAAVEQSNDAIQITDGRSEIMYVNNSFVRLTGYSKEEALGRPATDIMKITDVRSENGPLSPQPLKTWAGEVECTGRRKSGTALKQHLKLIPVSMAPDQSAVYHVTIRRLLGSGEDRQKTTDATPTSEYRPGSGAPSPKESHIRSPLIKTQTLPIQRPHPHVDTPLAKVVNILGEAQKSESCPHNIREALDHAMEVLRTSEPYAPQSDDLTSSRGIVQGLLYQSTRRHTVSSVSEPPVRTIHMSPHLRHSPVTPPPQQLQEALEGIDGWEYDIIHLEHMCQEAQRFGPLYYVGSKIFKDFNLCDTLGVDDSVVSCWLKLMESHYKPNPYHNSTHAADVLHATAYLVKQLQDKLALHGELLDQTEIAAIFISAVVHDLDHPGFTNPFLCNSKGELAVLYNDKSVLENHHVSLAFRLTEERDNQTANIFQSLDGATYREMRTSIIDMVLATDMSQHFEHLTKFNTLLNSEEAALGSAVSLTKEEQETRQVMKRIIVKCADISNPLRPMHLCREWAWRIAREYFTQTEEEKSRHLPIVFSDFDRETCNIPTTQIKFMDFFITGLFESWHNYCRIPELLDQLTSNYETWKNEIENPAHSEEEH